MAYFERFTEKQDWPRDRYRHRIGKVVCDDCADAGAVTFTVKSDGVPFQDRPWCWAPYYGTVCGDCGTKC